MTIWRQHVCIIGNEDIVTDPPDQVLSLMVVGGVAYCSVNNVNASNEAVEGTDLYAFKVPARALMHVLQAAVSADEDADLGRTVERLAEDLRARIAAPRFDGRVPGANRDQQ